MRSWIRKPVTLAVVAALLAPLAASAADITVGGRGSQVWVPSRRWMTPGPPAKVFPVSPRVIARDGRRIVAAGRPVVVVCDDISAFGQPVVPSAPPLVIKIEGDVTIVPQEDGSLRLVFDDEE